MMTDEIVRYESASDCTALAVVTPPKKTRWCRYCEKWMNVRGFDAHVHFRHLSQYLVEFRWTMLRNHADLFWESNQGNR